MALSKSCPDPRTTLKACCGEQARAVITFAYPLGAWDLRFQSLGEETARLTATGPLDPAPRPGSGCSVQYFRSARTGIFLSHVVSYTEDFAGNGVIGILLPTEVLEAESRRDFRVLIHDGQVNVQFTLAGAWRKAELLDLSRSGLRMRTSVMLEVDARITVKLSSTGPSVLRTGRVVRCMEDTVAVAFHPDAEGDETLSTLVARLERAWLRKRRERASRP